MRYFPVQWHRSEVVRMYNWNHFALRYKDPFMTRHIVYILPNHCMGIQMFVNLASCLDLLHSFHVSSWVQGEIICES